MHWRGFLIALTAVSLTWPLGADATPYTYSFESGAATVLKGKSEGITGSFTFDAATDTDSAVSITLSGASPYAGLYTTSSTQPLNSFTITAEDQTSSNRLELFFANSLQYSPEVLTLVFFQTPQEFMMGSGEIDNGPVGTAVSPTAPAPVAEPSALALLGAALGLLLLARTAVRGVPRFR